MIEDPEVRETVPSEPSGQRLTGAQRTLVLDNQRLVHHVVNRLCQRLPANCGRDDLLQAGTMGLIDASMRFDGAKGVTFSTYAVRRIEGSVLDLLRKNDWAPRSVRRKERELAAAADEDVLDAHELHRLRADIQQASVDSLDRSVGSDNGDVSLAETLIDSSDPVESRIDKIEIRSFLRDAIALLPERQRIVLVGFYLEGRTMTDLGQFLGVTQSRASQIKEEGLSTIRNGLRAQFDDEERQPAPGPKAQRQARFNDELQNARQWRDRLDPAGLH